MVCQLATMLPLGLRKLFSRKAYSLQRSCGYILPTLSVGHGFCKLFRASQDTVKRMGWRFLKFSVDTTRSESILGPASRVVKSKHSLFRSSDNGEADSGYEVVGHRLHPRDEGPLHSVRLRLLSPAFHRRRVGRERRQGVQYGRHRSSSGRDAASLRPAARSGPLDCGLCPVRCGAGPGELTPRDSSASAGSIPRRGSFAFKGYTMNEFLIRCYLAYLRFRDIVWDQLK